MTNRVLKPIAATAETLAGYGYLIGEPSGLVRDKMDFYGADVKVTQPARFNGNADLCLNLVSFQPRAMHVKWMEFHTKHTQTFIPLSGKPFVMVLGKATCLDGRGERIPGGRELPDPDTVRAFNFDGSGGIVMEKGVWHEVPFPLDGLTHFVCICTNETNDNLEDQMSDGECQGGDLTKRNMTKRLGYTFEIAT